MPTMPHLAHTRLPTIAVVCAALLAVSPSQTSAQNVPTRALTRADATIAEPFTYVGSVRELRDGRVIVSDRRDKTLHLADFARNSIALIGREGSGPGEYGLPASVLPLPGDSTLVWDMLNSRFLIIRPDGRPGDTFRIDDPAAARGQGGGPQIVTPGGLRNPRAVDARGRLYFEGAPFAVGADGRMAQADSVPVLRYDRTTRRTDTLVWLNLPKSAASVSQSGSANNQSVSMRVGSNIPFDSRDSWAVFPDGRIAVARLVGYRVEVVGPGNAKVTGPSNSFTPVRVGAAEKDEYRKVSQRTPSVSMSVSDNNGVTQRSVNTAPAAFSEPQAWPATKPPFVNSAVYVRENGEIWVQRHVRAGDVPTFDVFNAQGRLTQRVTLPKDHRFVGFGRSSVYAVSSDEDDLQYLKRLPG